MKELEQYGCLWVGETCNDFMMGDGVDAIDLAPALDKVYIEYNQNKIAKGKYVSGCTLVAPVTSLSSMFNYTMTDADWEDLWKQASKDYGYVVGKSNYTQKWVDCVVKRWNKNNKDKQVVYLGFDYHDWTLGEVQDKCYLSMISIKGNTQYAMDRDEDGEVTWVRFAPTRRWHATTLGIFDIVVDSFAGRKNKKGQETNRYTIADVAGLIDNGNMYSRCYVIVPDPQGEIRKKYDKQVAVLKEIKERNSADYNLLEDYQDVKDSLNKTNNLIRKHLGE